VIRVVLTVGVAVAGLVMVARVMSLQPVISQFP
jgi:hypothetical protein